MLYSSGGGSVSTGVRSRLTGIGRWPSPLRLRARTSATRLTRDSARSCRCAAAATC